MELRHLRYFVAVAEDLHFGRAAAKLHIAQPPLSQQIQKLEAELGVMLLKRTKRRVELTTAGVAFLARAKSILEDSGEAVAEVRRVHQGDIGELRIGFVGSAAFTDFPTILRNFRNTHSDVQFMLTEMTTAQQIDALMKHKIDIGFARPMRLDDRFQSLDIVREPFMLVLPQDHYLARSKAITIEMLAKENFVLYPPDLGPGLYDPIHNACREAGFEPRVVQEATQMHTVIGLVAAGFGIALVPQCVSNLTWPGVVMKQLSGPTPSTKVSMIWACSNQSSVLRAFVASELSPAS